MHNGIKEANMSKKYFIVFLCLFFLGTGSLFVPAEGLSGDVDLHVGIGFPLPPAVVISAPPAVYPIPGSYAYFAPDVGSQLFFQSGYWYRPYNGYWYRAAYYNGPWSYLPPSRVPVGFSRFSHNYYRIPPGQRLIPYRQLNNHWYERERGYYRWQADRGKNSHRYWGKDRGRMEWKRGNPSRVIHRR
jgi:hypothetical protein